MVDYANCPCTGGNLERFLRPCVLAVLARHPEGLHGYVLQQHLQEIALFGSDLPDATGTYRLLKALESEGYLSAAWEVEESRPAKRIYKLTQAGFGCLRLWHKTLQTYRKNLGATMEFIEASIDQAKPLAMR